MCKAGPQGARELVIPRSQAMRNPILPKTITPRIRRYARNGNSRGRSFGLRFVRL